MLLELLNSLSHVFYMALHVVNAGSFPRPLTADKEHEYLEAYRKGGDNHARDQLIEHNLRLVAHIIKKYYGSGSGRSYLHRYYRPDQGRQYL